MRCAFLLLFLLQFFLTPAQKHSFPFKHYNSSDGLCSNALYFGMQDSRGYLWFCTDAGVNRFDGKEFEQFTVRDSLTDNENFRCIESSDGRIWFSAYNGQLCYYDGYTFKNQVSDSFLHLGDSSHSHFTGMAEDHEGRIWFSRLHNKGVNWYQEGAKGRHTYQDSLWEGNRTGNRLFFLLRDTMHYFNSDSTDLFRINCRNGSATRVFARDPKLESAMIRPTAKLLRNDLYFNDWRTIYTLRHDSLRVIFDIRRLPVRHDVILVCFDFDFTNNRLWLGTSHGLLLVSDPGHNDDHPHYEKFFPDIAISSLFTDREGGLWITTMTEGLYYLPGSSASTTLVPIKSLTAIRHAREADLYAVGSYYGDLKILSGTQIVRNIVLNDTHSSRVRKIRWMTSDKLLIGLDANLKEYDLRKNKSHIHPGYPGLWQFFGCKDFVQGTMSLWQAGFNTLVLFRNLGTDSLYPDTLHTIPDERFRTVAEDGKSGCWFSSVTRLYRLNLPNRQVDTLGGPMTFKANLSDLKTADGRLWVATDGNGVFIFKNNLLVKHLNTGNSGLSSNTCRKLFFDGDQMWVATSKSINGFDIRTEQCIFSIAAEDVRDLDIYNGKLYAAAGHGVMIVDLTKYKANTLAPEVRIKSFMVGGKPHSFFQTPVFSYFNGPVKVKYTSITFESNEMLRYRYRFKTESNWNETSSNELEFYNLPPGEYTILLSAKKYNGPWSGVTNFTFTITPLWYQTLWFRLLLLFVCLGILILTSWLFIRSARRKSDLQRRSLESELKAIRLYMNPHFIFNSLSSLQAFVLGNKWREAGNYISHFAKLIRRTMTYSERNAVSLEEEIGFLKNYIELEQSRFEDGFDFRFSVPENTELSILSIPPLVIQPIVENAIKYGLNRTGQRSVLELSFTAKDDLLFVVVQDNGPGRRLVMAEQATFPNRAPSTGIRYTEERLRLLLRKHKVTHPVVVEDLTKDGEPAGTKVTLIIPLIHE